jgi:allantoinase
MDVLIRGARVVTDQGVYRADVGLADGRIAIIGEQLPVTGWREVVEADGLHLLPGLIDPHVHFNEPGRTEWEGLETGSRALAAGGVTSFIDMPLNSSPPVVTAAHLKAKQTLIEQKSVVNGYCWGGLVPGHLDDLAEMHAGGALGFKAFMSNSGIDEFPAADDYTLYEGMRRIQRLGSLLAVHAENDAITAGLTRALKPTGSGSAHDYLASRPPVAELEAVTRALLLAEQTGCPLYVVHTTIASAVAAIHSARLRGVDATCETCPHYLTLTDADLERLGPAAKCAPPLRSATEQAALWDCVLRGEVQVIASDHSPSSPHLKASADFFAAWGGIAGCQSTLSLLITEGYHRRGLSLPRIVAMTSTQVAQRFRLAGKGRVEVGADADVVLVDVNAGYTLRAEDLHYRHQVSPYIGMTLRGQVVRTYVGGRMIYREGEFYG